MAAPEWMEIFRSWSTPQLQAQIDTLNKQISVFSTQQVGSKSFTKDLRELRDQLSSAVRTLNERSLPPGNDRVGITDFRNINNGGDDCPGPPDPSFCNY